MGVLEFVEFLVRAGDAAKTIAAHPFVLIAVIIFTNGKLWKALCEFKRDFEETKAQNKRWSILSFARSCRNGEKHTREEWKHAISELAEYEAYTEKKKIENGVIEEDAKYLRELYHERNVKNDFV